MDKNDYPQGERDQYREHNPQPRRPSFMLKASMRRMIPDATSAKPSISVSSAAARSGFSNVTKPAKM